QNVLINPASAADAGTYIVTVTDALGCTQELSVDAIVPPNAGPDQEACAGSTVNLQGSNPDDGTWSADGSNASGATLTDDGNGAATVDFSATAVGSYTFLYSNGICENAMTVTVNSADGGPDPSDVDCFETGVTTLNASGSGNWTLITALSAGTADIAVASNNSTQVNNFSTPGDYFFAWDVNGCLDTVMVTALDNCGGCGISNNNISPIDPNQFCGSSEVQLITGSTASPSGVYMWQSSIDGSTFAAAAGTNNTQDYNTQDLSEGIYNFRRIYSITDPAPCSDTSNVVSIEVTAMPVPPTSLSANPNPLCLGETSDLFVDNVNGAEYTWTASSPDAGLGTSTTNTNSMTPSVVGVYTITITQTVAGCESAESTIDVEVLDNPPTPTDASVSYNNPTACQANDGNIILAGLENNSSYTVQYLFNGSTQTMDLTSNGSGMLTMMNLSPGTYTNFTLNNQAGCESGVYAGPINLTDPGAPDAPTGLTAMPNPVCFTGTVNLSVDNNPNATYNWSASSALAGLASSTTNTTSMTATEAGTYTISVTQTIAGCESPAVTISVEVLTAPATPDFGSITSSDPTSCGLSDGSITLSGLEVGQSYDIDYTFNGSPLNATLTANLNGEITLLGLLVGTYSNIKLTNDSGCESGVFTGVITISDPGEPDAPQNLVATPNPACIGEVVNISVDNNSAATYSWTVTPQTGSGFVDASSSATTMTPYIAGIYTVSVTQTINGCTSVASSIEILVRSQCLNPDFGVTWNDVALTGDLSTNDNQESGTTYSEAAPLSNNPDMCIPMVLSDGSYTFTCSTPGEYNYLVEVCRPGSFSDECAIVPLQITVLELEGTDNPPLANHDYIATSANNDVVIDILSNDKCQSLPSCILTQPTIFSPPTNGSYNVNTGTYTPNSGYVGVDFFIYEVCQNPQTSQNCDTEIVYINVYPNDATQFTNAMDDYGQTPLNTTLTVNAENGILANASDPMDLNQMVSPFSASVTGQGSIVVNEDGSYEFTPAQDYLGPIDFAYQVCRTGTTLCDSATLHLLVEPMAATGSISACVWLDDNGNGIYQPGEQGIANVTVNIFDLNDMLVATTITNSQGVYSFTDIPAATYYFEFIAADIYELTFPNIGNDTNDSDVDGSNGMNTTTLYDLQPGQVLENVKAGYYECAEIGNNVWYDWNKNDIYDDTENGIVGLEVNLWRKDNNVWGKYETTHTGEDPDTPSGDGYFIFCAPPGTYYVEFVEPPSGLVLALPFKGSNSFKDSDVNNANGQGTTSQFSLQSGDSKLDIGAGYYPEAIAGNLVWADENFDGIQNPGEAKIAGVLVKAIDAATLEVIGESITDIDGKYEIDNLSKRDVYFHFTPPVGFVATIPDIGFDNIDSDVDHTYGLNTTRKFVLTPDEMNENIDFGVAYGALPVTWVDVNVAVQNGNHNLEWIVEQEVNVDAYEVERAIINTTNFEVVSNRVFSNNVSTQSTYNFVDKNLTKVGKYYYRIKQYDFDGKFNYSRVISIDRTTTTTTSRIFPNPSNGNVNIELSLLADTDVSIDVFTTLGELVYSTSRLIKQGNQSTKIDLSNLESGAYNISLSLNNEIIRKRIIIIE
ncbi:MAG: SdrD B-like domain-containing protein, partial [Saprospiraceae bacterium]